MSESIREYFDRVLLGKKTIKATVPKRFRKQESISDHDFLKYMQSLKDKGVDLNEIRGNVRDLLPTRIEPIDPDAIDPPVGQIPKPKYVEPECFGKVVLLTEKVVLREDDDIKGYEMPSIPESLLSLIEEERQNQIERCGINEELLGVEEEDAENNE